MTRLEVHSYLTHKLGNEPADCEDALCFNRENGCFAVADGATEAFDSGYWARILTRAWVRWPCTTAGELVALAALLAGRIDRRWQRKALPWYAEEKARHGAFAAFIGLQLSFRGDAVEWHAISAGDCCLIQLRNDDLVNAFPLSSPDDFGFRPVLLPSRDVGVATGATLRFDSGFARRGDRFLLLSDSVAQWFLRSYGAGVRDCNYFEGLLAKGLVEELDIFFDGMRASAAMKNDDIAVLRIAW